MIFYRYRDCQYEGGITGITYIKLIVIKETPCGYWIQPSYTFGFYGKKKWVSKTSRKKFAYPTKAEAIESFIARKKRQISLAEASKIKAIAALKEIDRIKEVELNERGEA